MLLVLYDVLMLCFVCREGIDWADIEWVDNVECLDLVEKVSTKNIIILIFIEVILTHA